MSEYRRHIAKVKSLPYDAEVEYLETNAESGHVVIVTDFIPKGYDNDIYFKFMPKGFTDAYALMFGTYAEGCNLYRCIFTNNTSTILVQNGTADSPNNLQVNINEMNELWMNKDNSFTINGSRKVFSITRANENTAPLRFFGSDTTSNYSYMRFYAFKWWKADELVLDIIPVRVGSKGFLYDKVRGKLYGNKGTGRFILGPDKLKPSLSNLMKSMVCWYSPKRQGCTNENMAENPVLKDLSGNGLDLECVGFGWNAESGIGDDGALVFSGKQGNYCLNNNKPILSDFTLVIRDYDLYNDWSCCASSSNKVDSGAFIFKNRQGLTAETTFASFNLTTSYALPKSDGYLIETMTPTAYNSSYKLTKGNSSDSNSLILGTIRPNDNFVRNFKGSISSFLLFDRTLSEAEIDYVIKNLID